MDLEAMLDEAFDRILAARSVFALTRQRCEHSLAEEEARISWRVLLFRTLIAEGWVPPADALATLEEDSRLLAQTDGSAALAEVISVESADEERAVGRARSQVARDSAAQTRALAKAVRAEAASSRQAAAEARAAKLEHQLGELHKALDSRAVIEQAKGMVMMREGCTSEEAFQLLVRVSQNAHLKLRDVAESVVGSADRLQRRG